MASMSRAAKRSPAQLPDSPSHRVIPEPPLSPAGAFRSDLEPGLRYSIGSVKAPLGTARHLLRTSWVVAGEQRLLFLGRGRWVFWRDAERDWQALDEEAVEAWIYRALYANRWTSSPAHVAKIMKIFRLQLYWPPVEARCAA